MKISSSSDKQINTKQNGFNCKFEMLKKTKKQTNENED